MVTTLVGGGLIWLNGYLETAMQVTSGVKDLTFRNLGWSGDSVFNAFNPMRAGKDWPESSTTGSLM